MMFKMKQMLISLFLFYIPLTFMRRYYKICTKRKDEIYILQIVMYKIIVHRPKKFFYLKNVSKKAIYLKAFSEYAERRIESEADPALKRKSVQEIKMNQERIED